MQVNKYTRLYNNKLQKYSSWYSSCTVLDQNKLSTESESIKHSSWKYSWFKILNTCHKNKPQISLNHHLTLLVGFSELKVLPRVKSRPKLHSKMYAPNYSRNWSRAPTTWKILYLGRIPWVQLKILLVWTLKIGLIMK